ncbi:MAG: asparagine synthase (glutamine-hydrolyzing) [Pseudomonadota bacterium]|nr:asparagine synthase (glutamine-hydrolyzing) [Pseudomonadota bacterium]
MCGIAGWIAQDPPPPGNTIHAMLDAIAHRGPDDQGTYYFQSRQVPYEVMLGHRRLAIIDPDGARQPMHDGDTGISLVFNGEIYNFRALRAELLRHGYQFTRDSDTEVLLRAYQHWGEQVVHHLRGMFAFAISDPRKRAVLFARDRFGEKPLFLCQRGKNLYFASEIKALLQVPGITATVDQQSVWDYLAYRYVPAPGTLFKGIFKLMPGTLAVWDGAGLRQTRYWTSPDRAHLPAGEEAGDPVEGFTRRLEEAVALQMVSDVPFGAFLSGGLDSSTIVALMSRHNPSVMTFSVGFRETAYNELPYAAEVARQYNTRHHELVITHDEVIERLAGLVGQRDAPVSEPSDIAMHLLAREASRSVKMVLTGEGSDEVLGGYPKHSAEGFSQTFQKIPAVIRKRLLAPLTHALPYRFRRVKTAMTNFNIEDWGERQVRWFGAMSNAERAALTAWRPMPQQARQGPPFDADPGASPLRRILYFDQTSWLPDNLLERADRMTMGASLESRVPFLDHELIAYVSRLPDHFRVRGRCGKWILRAAARKLLPERILTRPKVGFRVPVNEWFRGPMRGYLQEHLLGAGSITRDYFDRSCLQRLVKEHLDGAQNHEKLLWTLLNLEIWHRRYVPTAVVH